MKPVDPPSPFTQKNPYMASIKERYSLCNPGSTKCTQHIVIDLSNSGITYRIGDSLGVHPQNDPNVVAKTLYAMKATGHEIVMDRHAEKTWKLRDFLTSKANISEVSKKFLLEIANRQRNERKKQDLDFLHGEENKELLKDYLAHRHLWDVLAENEEVVFAPQELCNLLMPLLPRLYSISSAQKVVGNEVHLTVALLEYESNGYYRRGVCTHYLCELAPLHSGTVPIYIQPHHGFTLPDNPEASIIMVGPGTGVAPFRAFMQERLYSKATGRNWLFFGEWNASMHFFYKSLWDEGISQGKLKLNTAFSRDQDHKIYVQHRMFEEGKEIFQWLEEGAYFYVCGDAQRMAKDVEAALLQILQIQGGMDEQAAKLYLKKLRSEKRYLRDVY